MTDKFIPFIPGQPIPDPASRRIVWPGDTPEAALPATWHRLADGTIEAAYRSQSELNESIRVLALVKEAVALGGVVR